MPLTLTRHPTVNTLQDDPLGWLWYVSGMMTNDTECELTPELVVGNEFDIELPGLSKVGRLAVSWADVVGTPPGCWGWTATNVTGTCYADLATYTGQLIFPGIGGGGAPVMDAFDLQDLIDDGKIVTAEPSRRQFITSVQATPGAAGSKATTISFTPAQIPGTLHDVNWGDGTEEVVDYDGKQHVYANAGTYRVTVYPYGSTNHNVYVDTTVS